MGTIQIKRGLAANLPQSAAIAEIMYTTDTKRFYVGNGSDLPLTEFINYEQLNDYLTLKANLVHSHSSTDIDDFSTAVDERITLKKGVQNGIASLDANGLIPVTQIPITYKEAQVVADIDARDALETFAGLHALVLDATDDATVESGGAEYIHNGTAWIKTSELNNLDTVITWANIQNKPTIITSVLGLTDTPNTFGGYAGKVLAVNSNETALEFLDVYTGDLDGGSF
jgi:hypothetical protein